MRSLERRLRKLEAVRPQDLSGHPKDSPGWLAYWDQQVYRYCMGDEGVHLTFDGVRAAMQHAHEPGSLTGTIRS